MSNVIEIEHLYKEYRLGLIGYGTLREDLQSWWARARGKEDPNSILFSGDQSGDGQALDHILALNDINLTVECGERLGVIGKNGAGKTTLLKILSRIASPTKGTARIKGRVASLIAVGTGFHPELTGRDNIYLNGSILGLRKFEIDKRFDEIVDFSGVEQFIDTPVKRYSSGMSVRLGFAVAAHLDPDVLIVDEVLAVGDASFQKKCLKKMDDVATEGRTILFVSHRLEFIADLCSRVVLLDSGQIIKKGLPREVIDFYYSTIYSAMLTPLRERTDRKGNGNFCFLDSWIENENGERVSILDSGRQAKFVMTYQINHEKVVSDLEIGVALHSQRVPMVADLQTSCVSTKLDFGARKSGKIECIIPRLPLNGGRFYYTLIARSKRTGGDIEDHIENVGYFDTKPGPFFMSGPVPRHNFMVMDHDWRLAPSQ